jgi:ribonuclease G
MQFDQLVQFGREYTPSAVDKLQHYAGERPIFDLFNVDDEIEKALLKRVDLKSGGYLIIDQTEALTTVDVNTGGFVGARNFDDTIFKTNLEAGQAIARQLRLRNLGGIIIIDFIDMAREEHQAAVLAELKKQLARDRTRVTVSGFTQLGLVEMTRKRTRESLAHLLCEPCPTCQGRGEVKTARSVCHDILREILREARQFNPKEFRVLASAAVVEMLLDEESQHLAGLSDFIGKPISLRAEPFPRPSSTTSSCCERASSPREGDRFDRILVICTRQLGDVLLTTPLIRAARSAGPRRRSTSSASPARSACCAATAMSPR